MNNQMARRDFGRLVAGGALGAAVMSGSGRGEASNGSRTFAFGVIADAQHCDAKPSGTRYYRASKKKLSACIKELNQMDLAFTIHLGDFIDRDATSYAVMKPIYNRVEPPRYHVLGNHEFSVAPEKLKEVTRLLGIRDRYYSFGSHGWRFVVLDGNDLSLTAYPKGSRRYEESLAVYEALKQQGAPNARTWNGAVGKGQLGWLDEQLREADRKGEKVVVFCHFPVYPENVHNLWNDTEVLQRLQAHRCVVAYMNGHNHAGNYGQKDGVHYLTLPGMVETPDTTAYATVHVEPDKLQLVGYGRTPSRVLKIRSSA